MYQAADTYIIGFLFYNIMLYTFVQLTYYLPTCNNAGNQLNIPLYLLAGKHMKPDELKKVGR